MKTKTIILAMIFLVFAAISSQAQFKMMSACDESTFPVISLYHIAQNGAMKGFGFEGGSFAMQNRFSYFIGAKMQWFGDTTSANKYGENYRSGDNAQFSMYVKGMMRIVNHVHLTASAEVINLTSLELRAGVRGTIPITRMIGIAVEPNYGVLNKKITVNTGILIALK